MAEKKILIVGMPDLHTIVFDPNNPRSRQWSPFQIEIWSNQIAIVAIPENAANPLEPLQEIEALANLLAQENIVHETQERKWEGGRKIDCIRLSLPLLQKENPGKKELPRRHPFL